MQFILVIFFKKRKEVDLLRFVMCYKTSDGWKPIKDNNNNFIIEKILNNSKTELNITKLRCNLEIIYKWFYFVKKYKTKEIEPILDKNG